MTHSPDKLQQQLSFLYEIDKLKTVFRRSLLISDPERLENSAEHSWHLALYVLILSEYANEKIDLLRVLKMVLLHDIVEIDAGDTYVYDVKANLDKSEREAAAAKRIFGLLPLELKEELTGLWQEFEKSETPEARFANAVDRLHPFINNYMTGGKSWKSHNVSYQQVEKRMQSVAEGSVVLANLVQSILNDAVKTEMLSVA